MEEVKIMVILDSILREIDLEQNKKDEYVSNESYERLESVKNRVYELGENFGIWKMEEVKRFTKAQRKGLKVGDLVRVKDWVTLCREGIVVQKNGVAVVDLGNGYSFSLHMKKYCGKVLKISARVEEKEEFLLKEGDNLIYFIFTPEMFKKVERNEELERVKEIMELDIEEDGWEDEEE